MSDKSYTITTGSSKTNVAVDWQFGENEATLKSSQFIALVKQIEGRMYTVADAIARDDKQGGAIKSNMRFHLNFIKDEVLKWLADQTEGKASSFPF